jgi:hypothetical protein
MAVKREKITRMKETAKAIADANKAKLAAAKPPPPKPKEPSARERAKQFAKSVPKPK